MTNYDVEIRVKLQCEYIEYRAGNNLHKKKI
jgi:hypothetical protein